MNSLKLVKQNLELIFQNRISCIISNINELNIDINPKYIIEVCYVLKYNNLFKFEQLSDICGADYLTYAIDEWNKLGDQTSNFSRGLNLVKIGNDTNKHNRFAVIYHLLSLSNKLRIRLRSIVNTKFPLTYSLNNLWSVSNWFEREAFDLYGIEFVNHDDLRRILTDYGFEGFPCRKDFPIIGKTEVIYNKNEKKVITRFVDITNKEFVAKIISRDSRYG